MPLRHRFQSPQSPRDRRIIETFRTPVAFRTRRRHRNHRSGSRRGRCMVSPATSRRNRRATRFTCPSSRPKRRRMICRRRSVLNHPPQSVSHQLRARSRHPLHPAGSQSCEARRWRQLLQRRMEGSQSCRTRHCATPEPESEPPRLGRKPGLGGMIAASDAERKLRTSCDRRNGGTMSDRVPARGSAVSSQPRVVPHQPARVPGAAGKRSLLPRWGPCPSCPA